MKHIITVVMEVPEEVSLSESIYTVDDALGRIDLEGTTYKVTGQTHDSVIRGEKLARLSKLKAQFIQDQGATEVDSSEASQLCKELGEPLW